MSRLLSILPFLLLSCASILAQTEVQIHPSQVGLFGAGNGAFLRSNTTTNAAEWTTAASIQGTLLLPSGTNNYTLRHDGSAWVSNNILQVTSGGVVGIGGVTTSFSGSKLTVAGGIEMQGSPKIHSYVLGPNAHFGFNESSGAPGFFLNLTTVSGTIQRSESGSAYGIEFGRAGAAISFIGLSSGERAVGSNINFSDGAEKAFMRADGTWIFGTDYYDVGYMSPTEKVNIQGGLRVSGQLLVQKEISVGGVGSLNDVMTSRGADFSPLWTSPATVVSNGGGLTTSTTFSGDVSGTYNNIQIVSAAVGSTEIANGSVTGFDIATGTVTSTNLNNTGVASGTYGSATQTPVITVGTDGRIISASNTTISGTNIFNSDGTIPAATSRIVTIADGASLRLDASGGTTSPLMPFVIKGNSTTMATRILEYQDTDGTMRFRMLAGTSGVTLSSTTRSIEINGATTVGLTCNTGQLIVDQGGYIRLNTLTSDPASPQNGSFWANTTDNRMKVRYNSSTQSVATLENEYVGNGVTAYSSSFTLPSQVFYAVADANGGSFTITLDGQVREGIDYVIECRRNGTNTITFDAAAGYNLAVDTISTFPDDGAVAMGGGGTGIQAAHKIYYVRRQGSNISVK